MMPQAAAASFTAHGPESGISGRFRIKDWAATGHGLETADAWRAWARGKGPDAAFSPAAQTAIPPLLRRRVTPIGQQALRAAYGLAGANTRYVFSSRHGEFKRTLGLLQSLAAREPSSPAEFSLSVHNALAGLLSIATQNQAGHTAIAAGSDSFGFGFLEALGCLIEQPDEPVLLVYFDEPLPPPYSELAGTDAPGVAVALLLERAQQRPSELIVSAEPAAGSTTAPGDQQAIDFMRFFLSDQDHFVHHGARMIWRWQRAG